MKKTFVILMFFAGYNLFAKQLDCVNNRQIARPTINVEKEGI
jgi:hypothetical protein